MKGLSDVMPDNGGIIAGVAEDNSGDMATLLKYEQTFVDAVRATGGKNGLLQIMSRL